ncbi:nose resistant to fluoxetine protein 6-like isoform X2 [Xenia sp. Carnegie-2017]|uniref:nose resistant to fluoxetine protein 6-like isoform X2 n=1 Tax=Xenia sp. Carnegie-2017 TaxID=2897299 RepID=UPI001F048FB3|nr:nose resistant to fluoxetine protein 6-like isoform X2 [Xenia sp. Carnegie-2017]
MKTSPFMHSMRVDYSMNRSQKNNMQDVDVDASGKQESGVYGGNTLWYGSFSECDKLPDSRYCWTMFPGNITLFKNYDKTYLIEWGVCVPKSCTKNIIRKDFSYFFHNVSGINSVKPFTKYVQVQCSETPEYTASVILTIILCGILVGLSLLATTIEIFQSLKHANNDDKIVDDGGLHISMDKETNEKTPLLPNVNKKANENEGTFIYKILQSFSIAKNVKSIMNTNVGQSDLTYLHGIRVLSLFWIILFHAIMFTRIWPLDNPNDVMRLKRKLAPIFLHQAYGVDTFFVLSGLLAIYVNINKRIKNKGKTNWFKFYFHRFWRLTPLYMFVILLVTKLKPFWGSGPLWFLAADTSACSENWWKNLLYINNYYIKNICIIQSWQLSVDMQLYCVTPIFLLIGYRYGLRAIFAASSVCILGSMITTFCIAATKHIFPIGDWYSSYRSNIFFHPKDEVLRLHTTYFDTYFKTYCRVPPYAMGMVLGYYLHKYQSYNAKLSLKVVIMLWMCTIALALTDIYSPYSAIKEDPRIWSTAERAFFWAFKWFIWGLFIVWLIFACQYNYAGWVKNILAAKFWIPLSRINYAAFLVHFDVMNVLAFSIQTPIHFSWFVFVTHYLAFLVLTYCIAFVLVVFVELPFANIETLVWKRLEKQK